MAGYRNWDRDPPRSDNEYDQMCHDKAHDLGYYAKDRAARRGKTAYGRGSASGAYGRSSYSMQSGTFDGLPSLSRTRGDGAKEIFYQAGEVDMDDPGHGHAVIKNGKLVYKRRPGESTPVIDKD